MRSLGCLQVFSPHPQKHLILSQFLVAAHQGIAKIVSVGRRIGAGFMQRFAVVFLLLFVAACAAPQGLQQGNLFQQPIGEREILLMPLDVEVSTLTAGGINEPNAEWTDLATGTLTDAIRSFANIREVKLRDYEAPDQTTAEGALHNEIRALHSAVGQAILVHKYGGIPLPTKQEVFDWSLGPEVQALKASSDADYALFMYARDSFSSGGRVALQIAAAVLGVGVQGGTQVAFVSLIDLQTGAVSWFNFNLQATGDIRDYEGAAKLVDKLMATLPLDGDAAEALTSR